MHTETEMAQLKGICLIVPIKLLSKSTRLDQLEGLRASIRSFLAQYFLAIRAEPFYSPPRRFHQTYTFEMEPLTFALTGGK